MNLLRLACTLLALPGRLLIRGIDDLKRSNGVPPLGRFLRGCVHVFVWFVGFSMVVSAVNPPPAPVMRSVVSSAPTSTRAPTGPLGASGGDRVARVIDGDTFELADGRTVRVLGIDSCEDHSPKTPGGADATWAATMLLSGATVTLTAQPGAPDVDRWGRLLRYVALPSGDFGMQMVGYDHTGVYQGDNDASDAYLTMLYAHDRDHSTVPPPSGRECGSYPSPAPSTDVDEPDYVPVPDDDDDGESRFCRKRWWC